MRDDGGSDDDYEYSTGLRGVHMQGGGRMAAEESRLPDLHGLRDGDGDAPEDDAAGDWLAFCAI